MKKIYILILLFVTYNNIAQQIVNIKTFNVGNSSDYNKYYKDIDNYFLPFLGSWKNVNGNLTFKVTLFKFEQAPWFDPSEPEFYMDEIRGHFMLIQNEGLSTENIIYRSDTFYPNTTIITDARDVILGNSTNGIEFYGSISDNTIINWIRPKTGRLKMTIVDDGSGVINANWLVYKLDNIQLSGEPTFNIPKNTVLTKQ